MVGADLPYYVLYNLDVWAFIVAALLVAALALKKVATIGLNVISANTNIKVKSA